MIGVKAMNILSGLLAMSVMLSACAAPPPSIETDTTTMIQTQVFTDSLNTVKTGFITEQILAGADGDIHYSYYAGLRHDVVWRAVLRQQLGLDRLSLLDRTG